MKRYMPMKQKLAVLKAGADYYLEYNRYPDINDLDYDVWVSLLAINESEITHSEIEMFLWDERDKIQELALCKGKRTAYQILYDKP
jgi:hypothetical protein